MQDRLTKLIRHPLAALVSAVLFGLAVMALIGGAINAAEQIAVADDPAALSDRQVARVFDKAVAEREIQSALGAGNIDMAKSILDLAAEHSVAIDQRLADKAEERQANAASVTSTTGRFARGLWSGEPTDMASLAGVFVSDLFVFGDIRDAAREGIHYLTGQPVDPWVLGLSGAGIAMTAATYSSLGAGTPARMGFSVVKAARRMDRLNPRLAVRLARDAFKVSEAGEFVELASDVGRIESKAGTQAALDSLQIAENPRDVSRFARIAVAKGGKTRAILKLVGPAAGLLATSALTLATWLFSALVALIGFFASCKATAERLTARYLQWRKARRAREAELRACG